MALRPGVRSAAEMNLWPEHVVKLIFEAHDGHDAERMVRFLANFPMVSSSDYTGLWGDRESLVQVVHAGTHLYGWNLGWKLKFTRACDINTSVRQVLRESKMCWPDNHLEGGSLSISSCVMGDILDRLPSCAKAWVKAAAPQSCASPEVARAAYDDIHAYLDRSRSWIFDSTTRSPCDVHGQACLVQPLPRESQAFRNGSLDQALKRRRVMRPHVVNNSGTTCTGRSPVEKTKRYSDPSELPHAVYLVERKASAEKCLEDLFFQENSSHYHYETKLVKPLQDTRKVVQVAWSPEMGGYSIRRERSYTGGINLATLLWLGPEEPDAIQRHFEHFSNAMLSLIFRSSWKHRQRCCRRRSAVSARPAGRTSAAVILLASMLQSDEASF